MASPQEEKREPKPDDVIRPGPDAQPNVNIREAREQPRSKTPTDRLEGRADQQIAELQRDKNNLQLELSQLRNIEIPHLRQDIRWLESRLSWQDRTIARLQTSYQWAIAFNWLSFALVALGSVVVSLASFLPISPSAQQSVAAAGFIGLLIGVIVQAVNSYRGSHVLLNESAPPGEARPAATPTSHPSAPSLPGPADRPGA